ncbi:hypothetical protein K2X89_11620 [Myxococcota bacterium]|nr:hypothetical protein [Myxococcota bacterium]
MNGQGCVRFVLCIAAFWFLSGAACDSDKPSDSIATSEMTARFVARANASGVTKVVAELLVPGDLVPENVNLNGGDRLIAVKTDPGTLDMNRRGLVEREDHLETSYRNEFGTGEQDTQIEVEFDRSASGQADAPASSVTLPSPFALQWVTDTVAMTAAPRFVSRSSATPYFVVWDPFGAPDFEVGDELVYEVTGDCVKTLTGEIDWAGGEDALELFAALEDRDPPHDGESCPVRVKFELQRQGTIDPAYADGSFVGLQRRVLELQTTP